ncbi:MAG: Maf family protein [Vulcanimicrobiaceae bacterium]
MLSRIVLASASPRRLELLRSLGLEVEVRPSGYDEPDDLSVTPLQLAIRHARSKALDVVRQIGGEAWHAIVVAADTVVDLGGVALNKPADAADAARMLGALSGREHRVHTAYAIALPASHPAHALTEIDGLVEESSTTRVRFYRLGADEIAAYIASGEPMDKAGAYGIQGRAASLVESIDGDFYTVMGFPLGRFVRTMQRLGFAFPSANQTRIT